MNVKLKSFFQRMAALFLDSPIVLSGKTIGYSLVKSQKANCAISDKSKYSAPFNFFNIKLGDYSYISKNSNISNTSIGKFCSIGPNFNCGLGLHPTTGVSTSPMFYSTLKQNGYSLVDKNLFEEFKQITIGNDVCIGANVVVLDGVNIADGVIIGAGAVVTKDIPAYAVAVGVPAKVIKYRFDKATIEKMLEKQWWNQSEESLKEIGRSFFDVNCFLKK